MTDSQFVPDGEAVGEGVEEPLSPTGAPSEGLEAAVEAPVEGSVEEPIDRIAELEKLVDERTVDLQRLGAEYVNYKKRVDRDRDLARQAGIESVLTDFMPVLDAIALARQHEDMVGGFKMVAEELEKVTAKHGLVAFGAIGEEFDPNLHDALMTVPLDEPVEVTTVSQVMQQGYQLKGRVIRPARVAVANP